MTAIREYDGPNDMELIYQFFGSPGKELDDDDLRKRYKEITTRREFAERRAGFGDSCYAQLGDEDCSQTMWVGPLFYAVQEEQFGVVEQILKKKSISANARDLDLRTPLFHVARSPEMIHLLCRYGADPNAVDKNGFRPMHVARAYQLVTRDSRFVEALKACGGALI